MDSASRCVSPRFGIWLDGLSKPGESNLRSHPNTKAFVISFRSRTAARFPAVAGSFCALSDRTYSSENKLNESSLWRTVVQRRGDATPLTVEFVAGEAALILD